MVKLAQLPPALTLDGSETVVLVQGGVTKRMRADEFLDFAVDFEEVPLQSVVGLEAALALKAGTDALAEEATLRDQAFTTAMAFSEAVEATLTAALEAKADTVHLHDIADITGIDEALETKAELTGTDGVLQLLADGQGSVTPLELSDQAVRLPVGAILPDLASTAHTSGRTGVIIPAYFYPNNPYTDTTVQGMLDLIRRYHGVPVLVIINPGSGPGGVWDGNYAALIRLLKGAGAKVLGYVNSDYGARAEADVKADIDLWLSMYADDRISGLFIDEMPWELGTDNANIQLYKRYTDYAHARNLFPVVANPGANPQGAYFATRTADVILVHENGTWPTEENLAGTFTGGHAEYSYAHRGALVYSQETLDAAQLRTLARYVQWVYVTDDTLSPNPWDSLSNHLEATLSLLAVPVHTHTASDITGLEVSYGDLTDVPATFAPSAHTHAYGDLTGVPGTFTPSTHTHAYADITGKPSTFAPDAHTHATSEVTGLDTALADKASLSTAQTFTKAQRGAVVALTDGATITPDFSLGNNYSVTLGGNRTLANPTNLVAGQAGSIIITQDATGSRTLSYGTYFKWVGGTAPTLTTTAAAVDRLDYLVVSSTQIHAVLSKDIK